MRTNRPIHTHTHAQTALANAIANECGVPFLRVSAPEVVSGMSGESEAKIRQLFQEAAATAPCIVFIGAPWGVCVRAFVCRAVQVWWWGCWR